MATFANATAPFLGQLSKRQIKRSARLFASASRGAARLTNRSALSLAQKQHSSFSALQQHAVGRSSGFFAPALQQTRGYYARDNPFAAAPEAGAEHQAQQGAPPGSQAVEMPLIAQHVQPELGLRHQLGSQANAVYGYLRSKKLLKDILPNIQLFAEKPPKGFENFYSKSDSTEERKEGEEDPEKNKNKKDKKDPKPDDEQDPRVVALAAAMTFAAYSVYSQDSTPEITFQELVNEYLRNGYVEKLQVVNKTSCRVFVRSDVTLPSHLSPAKSLVIQLGSPESFEQKVEAHQAAMGIHPQDFIPIQYVNERDTFDDLLRLFPTLFMLFGLGLLMRNMGGGMPGMGGGMGGGKSGGGRNIFSMGKAFAAGKTDLKSKVKFKDVAGLKQAKVEVAEFVDFLKNPKKYEKLGAGIPKGGLLVGPPGTGKTLLAKAVAGEADRPFFSISGSDFIEMFVGVGPSRVRDLFAQAREKAPSIIFIDEIDAVGRKRGKGGFSGGGNDERENTLNQLLVEMDGFASGTNVVVLAGTNRADILDPALTRAGRFDRMIAIDKPDIQEREEIFMVHLKPVKTPESLPHADVARRMAALTPGYAGAEIHNICNEAAIMAARRKSEWVELDDFERATERTIAGMAKENNLMSQKEKRTIAVHESGHAVAGWFLEHSDPLLKVSVVPRSNGALGFAQYLPADMALHSKEALLDRMCVTLGGRAAEELFLKTITSGASDDLKKVTQMSYTMVSALGMNDRVGLFNFTNDNEYGGKQFSEETGQMIDQEARKLVDGQYTRVKELLWEKKDIIEALADKLFEKETLVYNDLLEVMGPRPVALNPAYEQFVTATSGYLTADAAAKDAATKGKEESKSTAEKDGQEGGDKEGTVAGNVQPA